MSRRSRVRSRRGSTSSNSHAHGIPIREASLEVASASGARFRNATGEDGRFRLLVSESSGWHELTVSAPGFRSWSVRGTLKDLAVETIVLAPLVRQCVVVTDAATARPVERFEVEILRETAGSLAASRTRGAYRSVSSPDGSACLESPWAYPWTVKISSPSYVSEKIEVHEEATVEVALNPGAFLRISVRDASEAPVQGVALRLTEEDDAPRAVVIVEDEATAITDSAGEAELQGIRPGEYRIHGTSERHLPVSQDVSILPGVNDARIDLDAGGSLRVHISSRASERDIEGAEVMAEPANVSAGRVLACTTDAEGRCSIDGLGVGRYQLRARKEGFVEGTRPFHIGVSANEEEHVKLEESVRLTGTVRGRSSYPGLDLEVWGAKPGVPFLVAPVDGQGTFAFEQFPSGVVHLSVQERDRNSSLIYERHTIPDGRSTYHVDLTLPDPLDLQGRIRFRGDGCGHCSIAVNRMGGEVDRARIEGRVDASGEYAARLPGRGVYVALVSGPEGEAERRILDMQSSRIEDFDLDDRDRITVLVVDAAGNPASSARVHAADVARGISVADVSTDDRGMATLAPPAEPIRIVASKDHAHGSVVHPGANGARSVTITLRDGQDLRIDLRDARTGAPIYRAFTRIRSSRTGLDVPTLLLVRSDDRPFSVAIDPGDAADLVIKAPGYAFKTVYGLTPGGTIHQVLLSGGLTLGIRVSERLHPCTFQLTNEAGAIYGLSTDLPLGPVPFTSREGLFNPIEPGMYVASLFTCDGEVLNAVAPVTPGETTRLIVFEP